MGRKPVLGLVGACLTSMAFMGCADNCCLWDKSPKKDTTISSSGTGSGTRTTGTDPAWRNTPATSSGGSTFNSTTAGSTGGASASGGGAFTTGGGAGGGGSFNTGASPAYPGGGSTRDPSGTGAFDRTSPPGSAGPDVTGGRSTQPVNYNDVAPSNPVVRPGPSTLPPIPQGNAAVPRTDDLTTGKSVRGPVIDPPPLPPASSVGRLPPASPTSTSSAGLPPAPVISGASSSGAATADGLPPIPTPPAQQGLDRGLPPPAPPPVSGSGVPTLPRNPATMQNN